MIKDAFNLLEYIKPDNHYVPLTTEDAKTIEKETKKEAKDFAKAALEFNKVDIATTRQKKDYYDDLANKQRRQETNY